METEELGKQLLRKSDAKCFQLILSAHFNMNTAVKALST